ncbi:hypothetical protein D3C86_895770 [compost metagenome]
MYLVSLIFVQIDFTGITVRRHVVEIIHTCEIETTVHLTTVTGIHAIIHQVYTKGIFYFFCIVVYIIYQLYSTSFKPLRSKALTAELDRVEIFFAILIDRLNILNDSTRDVGYRQFFIIRQYVFLLDEVLCFQLIRYFRIYLRTQ